MAISWTGFTGTVNEAQWSRLLMRMSEADRHRLWSGGAVTVAAGTRAVSVGNFDAIVPGVWFASDAPIVLSLAANAGSQARVDYVVAEVSWATDDVVVKAITGGASAPALTQTAGTLWQFPLARVTVPAGATTLASTSIELCAPQRRVIQAYEGNMGTIVRTGSGAAGQPVGPVLRVTDPGWPYRLDITASLYARPATADRRMRIEVVSGSTVLAVGISGSLSTHQQVIANAKPATVFAGAQSLGLRFFSHDVNGIVEVGPSGANVFDVHVIPA